MSSTPPTVTTRHWTLRTPARLAVQGHSMLGFVFSEPVTQDQALTKVQASTGLSATALRGCRLRPAHPSERRS